MWVDGHDVAFHFDALFHQLLQMGVVEVVEIRFQVLRPHGLVMQQRVFQHFGIAREHVALVERAEKIGVDHHDGRFVEYADFVLQRFEVKSGKLGNITLERPENILE